MGSNGSATLDLASPRIPTRGLDHWLGAILRRAYGDAGLRFRLRDGTVLLSPANGHLATVVLADRTTLLSLFWDAESRFGDAYASGRIEVEGDLAAGLLAAYGAFGHVHRAARSGHSIRASRSNVHHHYDLGNDFYRLWLDERLLYTCAYFARPELTLEEAQVAKMDHVCRKLRLAPGETVVEAGCGWGSFALHMARRYGVRVKAYNLSHQQVRHARAAAVRERLDRQVEFVEADYREIDGRFDAFVSVGMLEHVGLGSYASLARVIDRCLGPTGRGLLHFIGRDRPSALNGWIRKRIFPGAYAPTLSQAVERVLEPAGVSVLDVENLRLHYARTLFHWRERFEQAFDAVSCRYGNEFSRAWRLYLAGSQAAFQSGSLQLFQVLFARSGSAVIPWTRAALYAAESVDGEL